MPSFRPNYEHPKKQAPTMYALTTYSTVAPSTKQLIHDVCDAVSLDKYIKMSAVHDRVETIKKYLKGELGSFLKGLLKFTIKAVATTPVGALKGLALSQVIGAPISIWRKHKKAKATAHLYKSLVQDEELPYRRKTQDLNWDFHKLLADIRTVLHGGGLADIEKAYVKMHQDWKLLLRTWATAPAEPVDSSSPLVPYHMDRVVSGVEQVMQTEHRRPKRLVSKSQSLRTCDDAVKLWENLARIAFRYEKLRGQIYVLEQFILWERLSTSKYTALEREMMEKAWMCISFREYAHPAEILDILSKAVNRVKHKYLHKLWQTTKYDAFAYRCLPERVRKSPMGLLIQLEVVRRTNKSAYDKLLKEAKAKFTIAYPDVVAHASDDEIVSIMVLGASANAATRKLDPAQLVHLWPKHLQKTLQKMAESDRKRWTDKAAALLKVSGKVIGQTAVSSAIRGFKGGVKGAVKGQLALTDVRVHPQSALHDPSQVPGQLSALWEAGKADLGKGWAIISNDAARSSAFTSVLEHLDATDFIVGALTGFIDAFAKVADAAWKEWQLRNNSTFSITGWEKLGREDRVGILRSLSKDRMKDYIAAAEALYHAELNLTIAVDVDKTAEAMLAYYIALGHIESNRILLFFEQIVRDANYYSLMAEQFALAEGIQMIDTFIQTHPVRGHGFCRKSSCCYADLYKALVAEGIKVPSGVEADIKDKGIPVHAIGEKKPAYKVYLDSMKELARSSGVKV